MAPVLRAFARLVRARRGEALDALRVQCLSAKAWCRVDGVRLGCYWLVDVRARTSELVCRKLQQCASCKQLVLDNQLAVNNILAGGQPETAAPF